MAEDQNEDEDIVDAQALLQQIAGKKLDSGTRPEKVKDSGPEDQRQDKITEAEQESFPDPHLFVPAVEQTEIEDQQNQDEKVEAEPHPEGIHQNFQS
jgi:hypothetical protein